MLSLAFCFYSCSNSLTLDEQGVAFSKTQIAPTVFSRVGSSTPKLDTLPNGAIVERLSDSYGSWKKIYYWIERGWSALERCRTGLELCLI